MAADDELEVQIAARVDTRGRVEFGVIPPGGFVDSPMLPRARFMTRQNVNERRWLYSSEVAVSGEADGTPGMMAGATTVVVRIAARGVDGNRVEFALQVKGSDNTWGERLLPRARFFPLSTPVGQWLRSSALTITAPGDGTGDPGHGETCSAGMEVERGEFCRYPSYTAEFSVNVQGTGVFEGVRSQTAIDEAFTISGVAHRFAAENAGRVWLITHVGPSTSLPACVVGGEVEYGSFCEEPGTGNIFSVSDGGIGSYDGQRSGRRISVDATPLDGDGTFTATNDLRAQVWRIESVINGTTNRNGTEPSGAPVIQSLNCSPTQVKEAELVTCSPSLSGGDPDYYVWNAASGTPSSDSGTSFRVRFSLQGEYTIRLIVGNSAGSDSGQTTIVVGRTLAKPSIDSLDCSPSKPQTNEWVNCWASLSGGSVDSYSWSGGDDPEPQSATQFRTDFASPGSYVITLVARNAAGQDRRDKAITVSPEEISIHSIDCNKTTLQVREELRCEANVGGGQVTSYRWTGDDISPYQDTENLVARYSSAGTYTVTLTVQPGGDQESVTITVLAEPAPQINQFTCDDLYPVIAQTISCSASIANTSGSWYYAWKQCPSNSTSSSSTGCFFRTDYQFDGDTTPTERVVSYQSGRFKLWLFVSTPTGNAEASVTIDVASGGN